MNQFNRDGKFSAWRFIAHIIVRPWLWRAVSDMSKASLDSRDDLCKQLERWIKESSQHSAISIQPSSSKVGT